MKWITFIISVLLTGCVSHAERLNEINAKKQTSAQVFVAATGDALGEVEEESPAVTTAIGLNRDAQSVLGLPSLSDRLNVKGIISNDRVARSQLAKRETEAASEVESSRVEEHELLKLGAIKESENKASLIKRIWSWSLGTFGLLGTIALCVLFPPAIPIVMSIVGSIFGWLVKVIPSAVSMLGVVGKNTFDNVVKGVGDARAHFKDAATSDPDRTYKASEIQSIIDQHLAIATDRADKSIIDISRNKQRI